jgi:hypothetical protein
LIRFKYQWNDKKIVMLLKEENKTKIKKAEALYFWQENQENG